MDKSKSKARLLKLYLDGLEQLFEATLDKGATLGFGEDFYVDCINRSEMHHIRMIATWAITRYQLSDEPDEEFIREFIDNCIADFTLNLKQVLQKAARLGVISDLFDPNAELRKQLMSEANE